MLSPRLQLKVAQKQILTPGLVQMVTVLQLNRMELKEMINQEIVENPVLEESLEEGDEITPEELQPLLEARTLFRPRRPVPARRRGHQTGRRCAGSRSRSNDAFAEAEAPADGAEVADAATPLNHPPPIRSTKSISALFSTIIWIPATAARLSESVEKPSFETFLSQPQTLPDYLRSQLSVSLIDDETRDAAESIIGNLDEDGYLTATLDEMAQQGRLYPAIMEAALKAVQSLDPGGVGARDLRECLLLQIESRNGKGGVAWQIVSDHMRLLEMRQFKELAKVLGRPQEHIDIALAMIRQLNPRPGSALFRRRARARLNPTSTSSAMAMISSSR